MRAWLKEFLRPYLSGYRFFRKWHGGKWELWWVDVPVCSEIWHDVDEFTHVKCANAGEPPQLDQHLHPFYYGFRPTPLCRGTPMCEDWT